MEIKQPTKVTGHFLTPPAVGTLAVPTETTGTIDPVDTDGEIIGVSVSESYSRAVMGVIGLKLQQGDYCPLKDVTIDQLLPTSDRPYFPVSLAKGDSIEWTVKSRGASSVLVPVVVTLHYNKNK